MEKQGILKQIQQGESATLEFKQALPGKDELARLIGALANSEGGKILVGVSDRGEIVGTEWSDETGRYIAEVATNNCQPPIRIKMEPGEVAGKCLVTIEVPKAEEMLHSAGGRFYIRVGSTNRLLAPDEIRHRMFERGMIAYDEMVIREAASEDLDGGKVRWFLERRTEFANVEVPDIPVEQVLLNLKALKEAGDRLVPTTTGLLFFGADPQHFIHHSQLKAARFKGCDMMEFIDEARAQGTLPDIVEETIRFVRRNTRRASKIVDFYRVDIPEYPYDAIREGIINALAHRDYATSRATVRVMIFDDRIEIDNPGVPPVEVSELEGRHIPRNELICERFHDIGFMEEYGTGIGKMKRLMREHGLEEPVMEKKAGFFKITFYGPGEGILDLAPSVPEERRRDLSHLNRRQIEILQYLYNENGMITNRAYRDRFGVTDRTALRDLRQLVDEQLVRKEGYKKTTRYVKP